MSPKMRVSPDAVLESRLMSPETWPDFERMFQKHRGCCGGCWCVYHILPSGEYTRTDGEAHRSLHERLVFEGRTSGVVCYLGETPVGWCQFGPADVFEQINRKKAYRQFREAEPSAPQPAWRITCVFVDKDYRGNGLSRKVLRAGVEAIRSLGGGVAEAYPALVPEASRPAYTGSVDMYEKEGFARITQLGKSHVLMRAEL